MKRDGYVRIGLLLILTGGKAWGQTIDTLDFVPEQKIEEVVVTAKMPLVEMNADKMTFRLESSITQSQGSLLDILSTLPGVIVQTDGTVYLNGQRGATILIDGKPTYLSGQDLITLLKSTPGITADKIDLITHPSARYDASGNSGIIDIRMKKIKLRGMNLSFNSSYAQGKLGEGYAGLSLNFRREKFNFYITYSFYKGRDYDDLSVERYFDNSRVGLEKGLHLSQSSYREWGYESHFYRVGFDYYLNSKTTLGVSTNGNLWSNAEKGWIYDLFSIPQMPVDSSLLTIGKLDERRRNFSAGVTLDHRFDAEGRSLDASFDYLRYYNDKTQPINSVFQVTDHPLQRTDSLRGDMRGGIHLYSGQVNLNLPFHSRWMFNAGVKSSYVKIDNRADYKEAQAGNWIPDPTRSSTFAYDELINATYVQLGTSLGRWSLNAGLRLENTRIKGEQSGNSLQRDSSFTRHYTNLFPTLALEYSLPRENKLSLTYGRRINRPNYGDLNPFLYIHDEYTYEQGNTMLGPEIADNLEFSFILKELLKASIFFGYTQDVITKSFLEKENHRIYVTPENLSHCLSVGPRAGTGNLPITPFWGLNINASLLYNYYRLPDNYDVPRNKRLTPAFSLGNQFSFGKGWSAELSGFYNGRMAMGQATLYPIYEVNVGIEKKVLKGKGNIRLYGRDILHSNSPRMDVQAPGQKAYVSEVMNQTKVGISFSYRFSKGLEVKESKRKSSLDESKRINL